MSEKIETFCRLCAEPTPQDQLISTDDDVGLNSKVAAKMLWINIEISPTNLLPNTICFSCFDLLERTWSFLHLTRTAQLKLKEIYTTKIEAENPSIDLSLDVKDAGKPVNEDWDDFQEVKKEVKNEILSEDNVNSGNISDGHCVKTESKKHLSNHQIDDSDSSLSDLPLVLTKKAKKSKKIKRKHTKNTVFGTNLLEDITPNFITDVEIKLEAHSDDYNTEGYISSESEPLVRKKKKTKNKKQECTAKENINCKSWADYMCHCAECDAQCKNIASLRLHSLQIHSKCSLFKCSDCGKITSKFLTFINHIRNSHKLLKYCCEYCNKQFKSLPHLRNHKKSSHYGILSCENCGSSFDSLELLQDHNTIYSKVFRRRRKLKKEAEFELKCELCQKEFKTRSSLLAHKLLHTERSRDFSCHVCGKMFFTKGCLSTHMATHEDLKPFKCDFCPLAFRTRGNLNSHISLHSGAKPFVCEQCGKSFRIKRHLKSHSIMHTDLRPYICEYCNKAFRFKTRLNLHIRQHTGAKPYTCVYCQRDFTNGSNYKKHMKRRHDVDTSTRKFLQNIVCNETITGDISPGENIEKL